MLNPTKQTLRKYKIATLNQRLHDNKICPANHEVGYYNGWYYVDENPSQRPEITRRAKELYESFEVMVFYNDSFNTYTLSYVSDQGSPVRGGVSV